MTDRQLTETVVGQVDWQTETSGWCRCPGEGYHTSPTKVNHCRVTIDGAPTVHCFHSSCARAIELTNLHLRQVLCRNQATLTIGGRPVLAAAGAPTVTRPTIPVPTATPRGLAREAKDELVAWVEQYKARLFLDYAWPLADIIDQSPLSMAEAAPGDQFRSWLSIWPDTTTLWVGDVKHSGRPVHQANFRTPAEWLAAGEPVGNYTCGSSFKPGTYSRSNENTNGVRFLVVESDVLDKDQVGAVFRYMRERLGYTLYCIIDTGGKSLHGWFAQPPSPTMEGELKAALEVLGCDPKMFTYSQPVRVPGAWRQDRLQRIIWMDTNANYFNS